MLMNEKLLKNLHKIFRIDPYIREIYKIGGKELDYVDTETVSIGKEFWFDTMSAIGIAAMEKEMDYKTESTTLTAKREEIEGRWKVSGKCDLKLLNSIANSWRNGIIEIKFTNGVLNLSFASLTGKPENVEALINAINIAKPAHLGLLVKYKYRVWRDILPENWNYYTKYTWREIMEKEVL